MKVITENRSNAHVLKKLSALHRVSPEVSSLQPVYLTFYLVKPIPIAKVSIKQLSNFKTSFSTLTDVHEAFDHVLDEIENKYHTKIDYPVAEFIIVVGKKIKIKKII